MHDAGYSICAADNEIEGCYLGVDDLVKTTTILNAIITLRRSENSSSYQVLAVTEGEVTHCEQVSWYSNHRTTEEEKKVKRQSSNNIQKNNYLKSWEYVIQTSRTIGRAGLPGWYPARWRVVLSQGRTGRTSRGGCTGSPWGSSWCLAVT